MSTLGQKPATQHVSTEKQSITGNGGTSYTLQQSVSQASDIEVFVNNTRQEPTVAYTASGTTLTMTGAVNSSDSFYVIFQGKAIQTAGLPVDAAITASTITTSQTITSTGNITTSGTVNTPSINGSQIGGRRNIIINGAMQVAQRGTSSTSIHGSGYYTCDRFNVNFVNEDELRTTIAQDTTGPSGFSNSFKITSTTAESAVAADEELRVIYKVEAQDLQQLAFGTSDAKTITVSFYVKSTIAATYGFNLYQNDANKVNGQSYTINSANAWERKTLTFTGNTSDVINNDNGIGMQLNWFLMAGSNFTSGSNSGWETFATAKHAVGHNANAVVTTTNATWQITGVQLEVGAQATPFEHRSFGEELSLCQRYYQVVPKYTFFIGAVEVGSASLRAGVPITRPLRASPTIGNITLTVYDDDDTSFSNAAHAVFANSGSYEVDGTTGYLSVVFNGNLSGRTDNHNVTAMYGTDGTLAAEL